MNGAIKDDEINSDLYRVFFLTESSLSKAKTKTDRAAISHFVTKTKTKTNRGNETLRRRLKRPGEVGVAPAAAAAAATTAAAAAAAATTAAAEAAVGAAYDGLVTSWACRNEGSAPGHAHPAAATPTRPPRRPKWLPRRGLKSRILHHSTDGGSVVCSFFNCFGFPLSPMFYWLLPSFTRLYLVFLLGFT